MHVEINTGDGVPHSPALDEHIHRKLTRIDRRFGDRLTRIEVFLKDERPGKGGVDKSCRMEARPAGMDPVVVDTLQEDAYAAVGDAADKLERALAHRIERRE